jgi:integral membrane sensor domain MASE1
MPSGDFPLPGRLARDKADLGRIVLLAAAYAFAAKASFALAFVNTSIAPVWLPSGLAVVAAVLFGYRMAAGVLLGAFLFNALTPVPLWVSGVIAVGNTAEAVCAAWLLRRVGFRPAVDRVRDVVSLATLGAVVATAASACVGVAGLLAGGVIEPDGSRRRGCCGGRATRSAS